MPPPPPKRKPPPIPLAKQRDKGKVGNVHRPPPPLVFLKLQFKDPEDAVREFPEGLPVRVVFTRGNLKRNYESKLKAEGRLSFPALAKKGDPWRQFSLEFPSGLGYYIACEPWASPAAAKSVKLVEQAKLKDETKKQERYFKLPVDFSGGEAWGTRHSDWDTADVTNATYEDGVLKHSGIGPNTIGSEKKPVVLTLLPHWKYMQFVYVDRHFGDSPPGVNPVPKITILPVAVEGFRNKPDPVTGDKADTHSNWTIGGKDTELKQCLPWIVRKDASVTRYPELTGATMGLRFTTEPGADKVAVIYSQDAGTRLAQVHDKAASPPPSPPGKLDAHPDRLRYYDLPLVWKSANYFTRNVPNSPVGASPPDGQLFPILNEADLALSEQPGKPLIFSLDDIVLTDENPHQVALAAGEYVIVFHHRFVAGTDLSPEGIYKPGADLSPPNAYPYSKIGLRAQHLVTDYPDWTRLVVAGGNLWDVFDQRTPDGAPNTVVGARAAVRWVDSAGIAGAGTNVADSPRQPITWRPFFAIQPFYFQRYLARNTPDEVTRSPVNFNAWASPPGHHYTNARFDIAHVRCADVKDGKEVSLILRHHRLGFNLRDNDDDGNANPMANSPPAKCTGWIKQAITNIANRWNGQADPCNPARAWIVASPPGTLSTQILTLVEYSSPLARAHFVIRTVRTGGGSSISVRSGNGDWRVNSIVDDLGPDGDIDAWGAAKSGRGLAAAHETGHCGGMPDDYMPQGDATKTAPWFKSNHVLGNPYQSDLIALMKYNADMRARYFWHAAQWLHGLPRLDKPQLVIQHGAAENSYALPFYNQPAEPGRHYVTWPVWYNFRQPPAGQTTSFDAVLYRIGADQFATQILPNNMSPALPGGTKFDGMLMVILRLRFDFSALTGGQWGLPVDTTKAEHLRRNPKRAVKLRYLLYAEIKRQFDTKLSGKRTASFQACAGNRAEPCFECCYIQFTPAILTAGVVEEDSGAHQGLVHIRVTVTTGSRTWGSSKWNASAAGAPRELELRAGNFEDFDEDQKRNEFIADMARDLFLRAGECLGVVTPGWLNWQWWRERQDKELQPEVFKPIVRRVMDPNVPNDQPTIT
jgi:hypothetical protein